MGDKDVVDRVDGDLLREVLVRNDLCESDLAESSKVHTYLLNFFNEVLNQVNGLNPRVSLHVSKCRSSRSSIGLCVQEMCIVIVN